MFFASSLAGMRAPLRVFALSPLAIACLLALPRAAPAQTTPDSTTLSPIVITANPLGSEVLASPSTVLQGSELDLRRGSNLGETLNGLPGVSTTTYGPMVGRPIIRGMDGDRIRLLNNGVGSLDASSLSFDHAVPQDPLSTNRIEILRGPAALLYGGSAIGGVVNTIDNRIPTESIDGIHGDVVGSYGGANNDRNGAVQLEGGDGSFAIHADAFSRKTGDLRIPGYARTAQQRAIDGPDRDQPQGTLPNSDGQASGGALGMSWTGDHGYAGLSYSGYDSDYGSVAEPDVRIKMHQERFGFASELRDLDGLFTNVKLNFAYTDYQHKEIEDGETGTIFKNRGYEARVEARHADIGPLHGVVGLQLSQARFSALGDEALVPTTDTDSAAVFVLEEWKLNDRLTLSAGARADHTRLNPSGGGNERFDGASRNSFTAGSFSLGGIYKLSSVWSVAANTAYTERAPTFYELYANGPHEATGQYLVGDQGLGKERAWSGDLSLRYKKDADKASIGVFYSRFSNYLAEMNTGRYRNDDGDVVAASDDGALPEARYQGVSARLYGVEAESSTRVLQLNGNKLDLGLSGDYTVARNIDTGRSLPRIPPLRLRVALNYGYGAYSAGVSVAKAFAQHSRPDNDTATPGYYSLDANAAYRFQVAAVQWQAYVRGINLTNQTIRYATSVLRDVAPEGGRAVMVGLRGSF